MSEIVYSFKGGKRYNDFSSFFNEKFSGKVQKISIDAGFTCPNRDGLKARGGCTYCNNETFNPNYCQQKKSIGEQLEEGIQFFARKYNEMRYLAYFQAYTNTYAPVSELRRMYEEALQHEKVLGLVVSTRPDCLGDEVLDLLSEFSERCYVSVELGLESVLDTSLARINRGHTFGESVDAIRRIALRGLDNCVHLMLGLPGESESDWLDQARVISALPVQSIKLHQLQIHKRTVMAAEYSKYPERYHIFEVEEYARLVVRYLELLSPEIVVQRFVSSAPADLLIAPKWGLKNYEFSALVERIQREEDSWQGKFYNPL